MMSCYTCTVQAGAGRCWYHKCNAMLIPPAAMLALFHEFVGPDDLPLIFLPYNIIPVSFLLASLASFYD